MTSTFTANRCEILWCVHVCVCACQFQYDDSLSAEVKRLWNLDVAQAYLPTRPESSSHSCAKQSMYSIYIIYNILYIIYYNIIYIYIIIFYIYIILYIYIYILLYIYIILYRYYVYYIYYIYIYILYIYYISYIILYMYIYIYILYVILYIYIYILYIIYIIYISVGFSNQSSWLLSFDWQIQEPMNGKRTEKTEFCLHLQMHSCVPVSSTPKPSLFLLPCHSWVSQRICKLQGALCIFLLFNFRPRGGIYWALATYTRLRGLKNDRPVTDNIWHLTTRVERNYCSGLTRHDKTIWYKLGTTSLSSEVDMCPNMVQKAPGPWIETVVKWKGQRRTKETVGDRVDRCRTQWNSRVDPKKLSSHSSIWEIQGQNTWTKLFWTISLSSTLLKAQALDDHKWSQMFQFDSC